MVNIYQEILERLKENHSVMVKTILQGTEGKLDTAMTRTLEEPVPVIDGKGRKSLKVQTFSEDGKITILEPITPMERMIIFGGGHVGYALCEFAAKCGFAVTVADDRPAFANRERFPDAEEVLMDSFANSIDRLKITSYDYVVIVTRGHARDADCVRKLLAGTEPYYMGLIGSRRRVQAQFEMLVEEGFSRERIDRIHTPIGLDIGAVTPAEIAVAILAEVIACKRKPGRNLKKVTTSAETENEKAQALFENADIKSERDADAKITDIFPNDSDLENSILKILAQKEKNTALVTLIETEGSTPRKAGAKMLVKGDGSIAGTVGGGLGEGLAIQEALELIGTGGYKILDFDLSGNVAEEDGMVCGGHERMLIEDMI